MLRKTKLGYVLVWTTFYILCVAIATLVFLYELPLPNNSLTLAEAEFAPVNTTNLNNIPETSWTTTSLPDNWRKQEETKAEIVNGWYRANIELEVAPDQLWAILVSSARMNIAIYLNGNLLGQGGRFADPVARNWLTPLFFSIPSGLLKAEKNILHVRIKADQPGMGFLPKLHLAPYEQLVASYDTHYFVRITSVQIITILLFAQSAGIGLLWFIRKREVYYGYYALGTLLWGLHNFNIFVIHIPMNTRLWDWFAFCTLGFYAFLSVLFFHRFFGEKIPKIEIPMLVFALLCSSILFFLDGKIFYFVALSIWYPAACIAGVYGTLYLAVNAWRHRNTELQIITASGIVTMFYATHDILMRHNVIDWGNGFFIQYAAVILVPGFAIILLYRFASSLDEAETLNLDLEKRVEEKHQELRKNHQKLQQLENERIRTEERERLMLDMHDGMGGSLVSTLAMIEMGKVNIDEVADALRSSLDDLYLMINSMDIQEDELISVLGNFRDRITPKLNHSNIQIEWNIEDIPSIPGLNPRNALHVLRILQEAVTNIIKHAHASKISFSVKSTGDQYENASIVIKISDNGQGFHAQNPTGLGIDNMHQRALSMGSTLSIHSNSLGTQVKLIIPTVAKPKMITE